MDVEENLDSPAPSDEKGQSEPESARSTSVPSRKSRNLRDSRDLEESARQSVAGAPRRGMHGRTPSITSATEDRGANVRSRRGDLQATSSFAGVDGSGVSEGHSHAEPGKNEAEALNRGYSGEKGDDLAIPQPSHRPFRELPIGAAIPKKDRATSSQGLSPLSSWAASSAALAELAEPLQSSESPDGDHERTGKNGQFFNYYRRSLGSLRCEWSPASLDPCTLRFRTAAQERSYHAQYLADSARDALVSVYMVTLFVMCGNVLAELASDGTIVGRTAYSVGVVAAAIGLLTVCAWKGRLFVDNYLSPEPEDVGEEDCEHDNDDGPAEDPLVKSAGGTSAKPISQKRGSLSIGATADRGTAKRRHARKRRGYCCPRDRRYLVLTPLAVLFFLNMAPFDLRCADEAVAVTGSFLPYVILLSSAGMGVAFTQPVVWFPLGVASAVFVCRSAVTTVAAVYMLRGLPHPFGGSLRALPAQFPNAIPTDSLLADAGEMTASLEKRTLIDIRIPAESENAVFSLLPNVAVSIGKITASGEAANPRGRDATGQPATSRRLSGNRQLSGQVAQVSRKASPPTGGSASDKSASEVPHVGLPARQAATAPAEPDPQAATAPAELDPQTATAPAEPDPQATTAPAEPDPQAATASAEPDPQAATAPAEPKPQAAPPSSGKALQGELELQNQQSTTPVPLFSLVLKVLAFNFVQFGPVFVAVALAFRFGKSKERESRMLFINTKVIANDRNRRNRERNRSLGLLAIVFPKPVIARLLVMRSVWNNETALQRSERALTYKAENVGCDDEDLIDSSPRPLSEEGRGVSSTDVQTSMYTSLEFADRVNNVAVAFVDFYAGDVFAGIGGNDGACVHHISHAKRSVGLLNLTFEKFDALLERYPGVDKIKTIGTKVMIAAGLFDSDTYKSSSTPSAFAASSSPANLSGKGTTTTKTNRTAAAERSLLLIRMALEALKTMKTYDPGELDELDRDSDGAVSKTCTCYMRGKDDATQSSIRFGVATGSVVAGIVGLEKYCFDLWGDAVNTASRMLSAASQNEIVITQHIREGLRGLQTEKASKVLGMVEGKADFQFRSLGTREIKGKGAMELFVVTQLTPNIKPSNPTLERKMLPRRAQTMKETHGFNLRRRPTSYRAVAAELARTAIGLAEDAGRDKAQKKKTGGGRTPSPLIGHLSLSLESLDGSENATASNSASASAFLLSPIVQPTAKNEEKWRTFDKRRFGHSRSATWQSSTAKPSDPFGSASPAIRPSTPSPLSPYKAGWKTKLPEDKTSRRVSKFFSDMAPTSPPASKDPNTIITTYKIFQEEKRLEERRLPDKPSSDEGERPASVSSLISGLVEELLNSDASENAHGRYAKLGQHVERWRGRFRNQRLEQLYLFKTRNLQESQWEIAQFLNDGCLALASIFLAASVEVFVGGPVGLDHRRNLVPATFPTAPTPGYWTAFACLVIYTAVAATVSLDVHQRSQQAKEKKKQRRNAVLVGNRNVELSPTPNVYSRMQRESNGTPLNQPPPMSRWRMIRPSRLNLWRSTVDPAATPDESPFARLPGSPASAHGSGPSTPITAFASGVLPKDKTEDARSHRLRRATYFVASTAFCACIGHIILHTPIGSRYWFPPALLGACFFFSIFLDIGNPSFLHAGLATSFIILLYCGILLYRGRIAAQETGVTLVFGHGTFILLRMSHNRSRRIGFLLRLVLNRQKSLSAMEARRSAQLLLGILPARILQRVIDDPRAMIVEEFAAVTFLHLDICDFTALSSGLSPDAVVVLLNILFTQFDDVCRKYDVEKMTTLGDAYVAYGVSNTATLAAEAGKPGRGDDEAYLPVALATCRAAVELQHVVAQFNASEIAAELLEPSGKSLVKVRVAVHTGGAHGCVLGGSTRLKYEFVGEAIRVAEKVQEMCPKGSASVSEATLARLGPAGQEILKTGHGAVDDLQMTVLPALVEGLRSFVMTKFI